MYAMNNAAWSTSPMDQLVCEKYGPAQYEEYGYDYEPANFQDQVLWNLGVSKFGAELCNINYMTYITACKRIVKICF